MVKIDFIKAPVNWTMDFGEDHVELEVIGGLVAEGVASQKANDKIQEAKNLNNKIPDNSNTYTGIRNSSADFTNGKGKSTLKNHVKDHGKDFGVTMEQEYLKKARNFLEKPATSTGSY